MTGEEHDTERSAVQKLLHMIEGQHITIFNKEEAAALKKIAELYLGFEAVGRFSNGFKTFVMWVGWFVVLVYALRNGLGDWLRGINR